LHLLVGKGQVSYKNEGGKQVTLKFIYQQYLKYNKGKGFISCHVEALHAIPPYAELATDHIVEHLVEKTGCAGIISTVSRNDADLNRGPNESNTEGIIEYRNAIKDIIEYLDILDCVSNYLTMPYLHLSFHGMKDDHHGPYTIEVGTVNGQSCSPEVRNWFKEILLKKTKKISPEIKIIFDEKFTGDPSIVYHRLGDNNGYHGYGQNFHSFQLEISRSIRNKHYPKIITIFSQIITEFQETFIN
jgi:hypothetical protein